MYPFTLFMVSRNPQHQHVTSIRIGHFQNKTTKNFSSVTLFWSFNSTTSYNNISNSVAWRISETLGRLWRRFLTILMHFGTRSINEGILQSLLKKWNWGSSKILEDCEIQPNCLLSYIQQQRHHWHHVYKSVEFRDFIEQSELDVVSSIIQQCLYLFYFLSENIINSWW